MQQAVQRQRLALAGDHALVVAALGLGWPTAAQSWLSFEWFRWGLAAVSSRAFLVQKAAGGAAAAAGAGEEEALVPLLDLWNHRRPRQCEYGALDPAAVAAGQMLVRTLQPLAAASPLHIAYGAKGAAALLQHYGFAPLVRPKHTRLHGRRRPVHLVRRCGGHDGCRSLACSGWYKLRAGRVLQRHRALGRPIRATGRRGPASRATFGPLARQACRQALTSLDKPPVDNLPRAS